MKTSREIQIDHSLFEEVADKINCGASGESISSGKYTLPIKKINLEGKDTFFYGSGMLHHGIKSNIDAFLMTPLELYQGETKTVFEGEFWDGSAYIGLIFSFKNIQYVVSEIVLLVIDPASIDFVSSLDECKVYEETMNNQGGWRSLTYERKPPKINRHGNMVTGVFTVNRFSREDSMVVTYVRIKGRVEALYIGESSDVIKPLLENVSGKVNNLLKTASQIINTPLGKEQQMCLF